jgi:hypothetical protein
VTDAGPAGGTSPRGTPPMSPTPPGAVAVWGVVGLAGGWLLHLGSDRLGATPPIVTWTQPLALFLVALVLGGAAHATWRSVHVRRERLQPHQALNRLVLARACLYVGALVAGGYLGYAVSWLGVDSDLGQQRLLRSLVTAGTGVLVVVAGWLLERACRVPPDEDDGAAPAA